MQIVCPEFTERSCVQTDNILFPRPTFQLLGECIISTQFNIHFCSHDTSFRSVRRIYAKKSYTHLFQKLLKQVQSFMQISHHNESLRNWNKNLYRASYRLIF